MTVPVHDASLSTENAFANIYICTYHDCHKCSTSCTYMPYLYFFINFNLSHLYIFMQCPVTLVFLHVVNCHHYINSLLPALIVETIFANAIMFPIYQIIRIGAGKMIRRNHLLNFYFLMISGALRKKKMMLFHHL